MKYQALAAVAAFVLSPLVNAAEKAEKVTGIRGNLTLEKAVQLAVRQNPDILRAKQEIERTRGQVIEVRAQALPQVDLTAGYNQTDPRLLEEQASQGGSFTITGPNGTTQTFDFGGGNRASGSDRTWRIAIEARQLLYSGGQVKAALKIARFTEDQSIYVLRETVDNVIAQARTQFYLVLLNRKLITVAEENLKLLEDELKDQQNRFDAGTVPRFNVLRAEVAVANAKPALIQAKNNYLIAELQLAKTLGLDASRGATAKPSFDVVGELRATPREWSQAKAMKTARERRAILKAQQQNIQIEEQQITVAKANGKPRVEASAGYEARSSRISENLTDVANGWTFGVNGSWPVFDGFETKGKVVQAQARLQSARISYEDSVRQVELEVQQAVARINEARELIASQGKVVEQALEALRLARERLAAGAGTQLEVLDAQFALTNARTTQQRALYDYNAAVAELDRATGAETVYDNTAEDQKAVKAKTKLRGQANLRD